jgi:sugar (pentulose or hexulose) kinase
MSGPQAAPCWLLDTTGARQRDQLYAILSPQEGWAEQRGRRLVERGGRLVRQCQIRSFEQRREVAAIGIDSHLEAFVPVAADGCGPANGLLWLDQRTVPQAEQPKPGSTRKR